MVRRELHNVRRPFLDCTSIRRAAALQIEAKRLDISSKPDVVVHAAQRDHTSIPSLLHA